MTDPIADLLTRIRNAQLTHKDSVTLPYSRVKHQICQLLKQENYIKDVKLIKSSPQSQLVIKLRYIGKLPAITHLSRVSKPGRRIYARASQLPRPLGGHGLAIISTSQGIMTHKQANQKKIGGEVICQIW